MKLKHIKDRYQDYYEDTEGRWQGEFKWYYSNDRLYKHCYYKDNELHGEYKMYHIDGSLAYHTYYENDIDKGLKYLKILNLLSRD